MSRIVIIGGGHVGMYVALRLQRRLRPGEATVHVIDPRSYMTYQPFLAEAAAGSLEPRHVVVSLRRVLPHCRVTNARVRSVDHGRKVVGMRTEAGTDHELGYDVLVIAPGSVARTLPIPGLADQGMGFKNVEEAIALRDRLLERMDLAHSTTDPARRARALTFLFVGGGYAGVEALGELEDLGREATRYYDDISPSDLRFVLVDAADRILPEVGPDLARYTAHQLVGRGVDVRVSTRLESCVDGHVVLSDGDRFDAGTIVWTAGVKAHPLLAKTDLPLDDRGRVRCRTDLRVEGLVDAWAAGDCAAVPDLTNPGQLCSPSAQHAVRQARRLADNVVAVLRGGAPVPYRYRHAGSVASLGLYKGVAQVYGIKVRGWPAWFMHRSYHLSRMPTFNRKVRIMLEWTLGLFFRRDVFSLGSMARPREEFTRAALPVDDSRP